MAAKSVTYRFMVFSVKNMLKQMNAENSITTAQVLFWLKLALNHVRGKQFHADDKNIGYGDTALFTEIPVTWQHDNADNTLKDRKFFELPTNIFDLDMDGAIRWISYDKLVNDVPCDTHFSQVSTLIKIKMMNGSPFERANPEDFYHVRINKRVYLFGIENVPVRKVNMLVVPSEKPGFDDTQMDAEIQSSDEELLMIYEVVRQWGMAAMQIPYERVEDGLDKRQAIIFNMGGKRMDATPQPTED